MSVFPNVTYPGSAPSAVTRAAVSRTIVPLDCLPTPRIHLGGACRAAPRLQTAAVAFLAEASLALARKPCPIPLPWLIRIIVLKL